MTDYQVLLQNHNIFAQVQKLILQNEQIFAIKLIKDKTGLPLKKCKDIVDSMNQLSFNNAHIFDNEAPISVDEILSDHKIEEQVTTLLQQNSKLEAIKLVIDHTDMNLLDAKNLVESIQNKETTFTPENIDRFSDISVKMTNFNGKITVKIKEGNHPEKIVYPNDPNWEKAKKYLETNPN